MARGSARACVLTFPWLAALAGCGGARTPSEPVVLSSCEESSGPLAAGRSRGRLLVDGACREYVAYAPTSLDRSLPAALVVVLHGEGASPLEMEAVSGLSQIAEAHGFAVVYPAGLGGSWNLYPNGSDTRLVRLLIEQLRARVSLDRRRVYVAGYSMGGGMANRATCELSDVVAAMAAVAGEFRGHHLCGPRRPVPVLAIHGANDDVIPPTGRVEAEWPAVSEWARFWAAADGCEASPSTGDQLGVQETAWRSCGAGAEVRLWLVDGLGHQWWPAAGDEIWSFFERHRLPG